jgi:hypothetical protein
MAPVDRARARETVHIYRDTRRRDKAEHEPEWSGRISAVIALKSSHFGMKLLGLKVI